ncbi:hypothetical protein FGO68_gene15889 [Halteria grandinella]|uniref:Uncharacterized protein n=1 Tax=Halteria grandinella TaxID=5974 RepID=A0A8J8T2P7_HALGN|nr:hypothetical protein FGO68_gene15889 [Halteria grandinella]
MNLIVCTEISRRGQTYQRYIGQSLIRYQFLISTRKLVEQDFDFYQFNPGCKQESTNLQLSRSSNHLPELVIPFPYILEVKRFPITNIKVSSVYLVQLIQHNKGCHPRFQALVFNWGGVTWY